MGTFKWRLMPGQAATCRELIGLALKQAGRDVKNRVQVGTEIPET